ncbi:MULTISPECIES: MEKHLA domain-containing protein [unclassified Pseudofrankia]|uniref:MEKHLA domain-containing protein n=1 Tax=unclassified Pseudofrankia TaxID=2994372 RepID=UPI0008D9BD91|nr:MULTISPECIES: MEKHLA domain-containing protein [unclassified Pseudofrankia]MDT3438758.1 MEKHLA domain-containing protein [Pseudofrankia sp. BMG5.37]OHV73024.1 MEKHLA domain-containing protein [Pseudofrankia sp. BMG5.36]
MIQPYDTAFAELLTDSYQRVVGTPMPRAAGPAGLATARWLHDDAPFGVLAHDGAADPLFVYANATAQRLFEYGWDEIVGLPSRLSAAEADRDERAALMSDVLLRGYTNDYRGLRVARSGRRFWIEDATVWNLVDRHGEFQGQAALIRAWSDA